MILLSGHSLTHARRVPLEEMSLQLKERDSTATITPVDMDGITVNSWMVDDTEPGRGIVWRVKSIAQAYATRTPTVQLEHTINSLRDNIIFGEVTAATITGNPKATTCTAEQAVRYILSFQHDWVLGSFGYNVSNPYKFDGDSLFDALETVSNSLSGCWWSYDMSVYPFRLNITAKPDGVASEMRAGRNLKVITKTVDKSGMYTRFYPTGKDDLHISGDYVERNANIYGVVSKVETDNSIDTEPELRRWATERLANHCEPTVTIDVEGMELADATGEPLDRLQLGRYCRVPLPEFGTTITERVVGLSYPDKVHNPEVVKITLANNRTDVTRILADAIKNGSGGRGGRTAGKQSKEDHAWFEDTDDHVAMCAEALIGRDANGVDWYRLSSIIVDGEGIHQKVERTDGRVTTAYTLIDQNEERIRLEAKRATDEEGRLSGQILVQADRITAEVTRAKDSELQLQGKLMVSADAVSMVVNQGSDTREIKYYEKYSDFPLPGSNLYRYYDMQFHRYYEWRSGGYVRIGDDKSIKAADICTSINESGDPIAVINAAKIYLLGQTIANTITANYIDAKISTLATLHAKDITANSITAGVNLYLPNGLSVYSQGLWTVSLTQDGNTYTLKQTTLNGTESTIGSFSRATTLTGAWSSGTFTVSASPQGNSQTTALKSVAAADVTWNGDTGTFNIYAYNNGSETPVDTGKTMSVTAPVPHAITAFDTNAPAGETYNNLTNNADGYVLSGSNAYIVVKSTWKCDGNDKSADSYLQSAPTKLYAKGKADADSAYHKWNNGATSTLYYYDTSSLSYKVAVGSGKYWYYK